MSGEKVSEWSFCSNLSGKVKPNDLECLLFCFLIKVASKVHEWNLCIRIRCFLQRCCLMLIWYFTLTFNNNQWFSAEASCQQQRTSSSAGGDVGPVMNCGGLLLNSPPTHPHPSVIDTAGWEDSSIFCIDEWWAQRRLHTVFSSVCPEERSLGGICIDSTNV